jgi:superfamily II DNA/RNA helicase
MARRPTGDPTHEDSKPVKLLEVLRDPVYRDEKLLIFAVHRNTLTFLMRRLEQLGYTSEVAQIHGGMSYTERDVQVTAFRKPPAQGGARFLVGMDAAGEGINLQFCWRMVSYGIPWNPARLEQRMGRIHRYGQKHDPVVIVNLVTADTREGKVLHTLPEKLEAIGKDLGRDKAFDVVGKLFRGLSSADYVAQVLDTGSAEEAAATLAARLTGCSPSSARSTRSSASRSMRGRCWRGSGRRNRWTPSVVCCPATSGGS